jgi:hypothetical protein
MEQVLGPLDNPRYMIPRQVKMISDNWVSKLLPEIIGKYFRTKKKKLVMFHSVPKKLAQNKEDAAIFQKHWNFEVSPGEVMYGYSKDGREQVRWAVEQDLSPRGDFHSKSVFT